MSAPNDLSPQNRRIHPRYPVMWQGTISAETEFDAYVINCTIRNVSITGVHVLVDRAVASDSPVKLHISGVGVFEGRVSWSEDERLGVQFVDAPDDVAELIKANV